MIPRDAEIRLKVDAAFLEDLKQKLGIESTRDLTQEAFAILNWVVDELQNNRIVISTRPDGSDIHRITSPALARVRKVKAT